jgi:hypothetical protein
MAYQEMGERSGSMTPRQPTHYGKVPKPAKRFALDDKERKAKLLLHRSKGGFSFTGRKF